jgi:methylamine dehydrogenase heavy chain
MRFVTLSLICFSLAAQVAEAQLQPEQAGVATLPAPTESWFMIKSSEGTYLFDGETGEMQGLMSHDWYTPAVVTLLSRGEAYYVESFYSRGVRGTREDVLTVVDMKTLTPAAEIDIPDKTATLSFRHHIGLLGDDRHVVIFNMTPAQSVSVVDVVDRQFVGEISTAGCAIIMPTGNRAFLMICGDGTLQYIELDRNGKEIARTRTDPFFSVDEDPVFDKPVYTGRGWLLVSYNGLAYEVTEDGGRVEVSEPWSLLTDEDVEAKWRPGGGQPFTVHRGSNLLYALMHQGDADTHYDPGSEVWVFDLERRKRVGRMPLETEASRLITSQETQPRLYLMHEDNTLGIYDGRLLRLLRTIDEPGPRGGGLLQTLARND